MLNSIYSTLSGQMENIWTGFGTVSGLVAGPLQTAMAINLMICGFAIMRGIVNEPWGAYLSTWLRAELAILAATSSFGPWLGSVAWGLPDQFAAAIGGGAIGGSFDSFIDTVSAAAWAAAEAAPKWKVSLGITTFEMADAFASILALLVVACAWIAAATAMIMSLFTKFALAVTIAVGPIFVAGLIFNSSSGMFFSWLGAVINAAINAAAVAAALTFVNNTVWSFATLASAEGSTGVYVYGLLIGQSIIAIVGGILVLQASSIASFAGGGGASGSSLVSSIIPSGTMRQAGNWGRAKAAAGVVGAGRSTLRSIPQMYSGPRGQVNGTSNAPNAARASTWRPQGASTRGK